ncbi:unnamed protein product, partial [Protopolystoma xenopodis]
VSQYNIVSARDEVTSEPETRLESRPAQGPSRLPVRRSGLRESFLSRLRRHKSSPHRDPSPTQEQLEPTPSDEPTGPASVPRLPRWLVHALSGRLSSSPNSASVFFSTEPGVGTGKARRLARVNPASAGLRNELLELPISQAHLLPSVETGVETGVDWPLGRHDAERPNPCGLVSTPSLDMAASCREESAGSESGDWTSRRLEARAISAPLANFGWTTRPNGPGCRRPAAPAARETRPARPARVKMSLDGLPTRDDDETDSRSEALYFGHRIVSAEASTATRRPPPGLVDPFTRDWTTGQDIFKWAAERYLGKTEAKGRYENDQSPQLPARRARSSSKLFML